MKKRNKKIGKRNILLPLTLSAVFIISLSVYIAGLCPVVAPGDSGELIAASYTMGIAHPTGYPVYTVLGKLFTNLPFGTIAARVNLMSAFFASLAAFFLGSLIAGFYRESYAKSFKTSLLAPFSALIFAFTPILWKQSVVAEVYSLNAFFIVLLMWLAYRSSGKLLQAVLGGSIFGLSLGNHNTMLMFFPLFLYFFSIQQKRFLWKNAFLFTAGGLFFFSLTAFYMYIRACASTEMNWGDPSTIGRLIAHLTRKEYGKINLLPYSFNLFFDQLLHFVKLLYLQFNIFLVAGIYGAYILFRKNKKAFLLTGYTFLTFLVVLLAINFSPNPKELDIAKVFFIPSFLAVSIFIACALIKLPFNAFIILPAVMLILGFPANNMSSDFLARDFAKGIFASCEKDSVLIVSGDNPVYPSIYLKICEKTRPDLLLINESGTVLGEAFGRGFIELSPLEKNLQRAKTYRELAKQRTIYFTAGSMLSFEKEEFFVPSGLTYALNLDGKKKPEGLEKSSLPRERMVFTDDYLVNEIYARYVYAGAEYDYAAGNIDAAKAGYARTLELLAMDPNLSGLRSRINTKLALKGAKQ